MSSTAKHRIVLKPILNPIWVVLIVGEMPPNWTLTGGVLVIGAVTVRSLLAASEINQPAVMAD